MGKFSYIVKDKTGKTISDTADASNREALISKLQKQGYFIVHIQSLEASKPVKTKRSKKGNKEFTHKKVTLEDLLTFAHQLGTMLDSGVTMLRSLHVIGSQAESQRLSAVMEKVTSDVEQGSSLSESLARHPKVFDQFWISLVEVGEASGSLPRVLEKLAFYLEQQTAFKSTITSAIIYPVILLFVSMGAITFFAFFVGPRFESIFDSFGVKLPLITRILLTTFNFIKTQFFWVAGISLVLFFSLKKYAKTYRGRLQTENILFGLPQFGRVFKFIVIERFASQMSILVESGVPILYALEITGKLVSNITCELIINDIREAVREGELLVAPMQRSEFFPPMALQMIMVGEETGDLSKMLSHVAQFYQRNVETFLKRFGTMIEPIMLVFMGGIIGVIVLAMFLPMFNITQLG